MGGFRFQCDAPPEPVKAPKHKKPKAPPAKIDPTYLTAARELRDVYLEHVNTSGDALLTRGKYDVSRLPAPAHAMPLLKAG